MPTLHVRIGRLIVDGRVATGTSESLTAAIQTELASLFADGNDRTPDARRPDASPLARSIAAGIARRIDSTSIRPDATTSTQPVGASATAATRFGGTRG